MPGENFMRLYLLGTTLELVKKSANSPGVEVSILKDPYKRGKKDTTESK